MTKEELEKVVQGAEYDFLRENPHLGSNIMFLTLGGSHAYGTNVPGSDVDVRGVTGDSKYDLLGFGTFEQVVEQSTDTTIYGFRKLVSLLINCNPNVIEMLGSKPDNYLMVSPEGQMLLDNKALFLSKKALYSFGGYANDQLRRLQMGLLQNDVNTDMKEEFALRSVQRVLSGPDLQHNAPAEAENHFNISIGNVKDEEIKRQLVVNAALTNFPLRDFKSLIKAVNATVGQFDSLGKRNTKKDFPHINKHAMHLVRLYLMAFDILERGERFLRGLNKPFDPFAQKAMHDTMIGIANCTEAVWAYHIGNEIVLYLNPNAISRCKTMLSGMTRDNLVSYIASLTTVIFNLNYGRLMEKLDKSCNLTRSMVVWCDDVPKEEESAIIDLCFDSVSNSLSIPNESGSEMTERMLHIAQIRKGRMIPLSEKEKNVKVNVWTVGTRGKGSIVSDFTQITLGELCEHFQRHYDNMEIVRSPKCKENDGTVRDFARPTTVYRSLFAKDEKGKVKVDNPVLWKQISRSVFMGEKYPTRVLDMVLCRADRESKKTLDDGVCCISATMAGIIKAYLINNAGKEDLTVSLNENNTSPAYLTGRIFAHMESAQRAIDPSNQTTFVKRYFARVMENPAETMPQMHLSFNLLRAKANNDDKKRAIFAAKEKVISELIDMLDDNYPNKLSPEQQGYFVVGYYQQRRENIRCAAALAAKNVKNND